MPTRFCLKNMGDPSSIKIEIATSKNNGNSINKRIRAKNLMSINLKGIKGF